MSDPIPTRETLLLRIRDESDSHAWNEFAELYTPLVQRYCRKRGLSDADTADITQEVLAAVSRAIKNFEYDPEKGTFRSWFFTITRNRVFTHFKKQKKQPQGTGRTTVHQLLEQQPDEKEAADWDLDYKKHMFEWAADKVRPEFKEQTWEAFWQTSVDESKPADVAESLGISVGAVYIAKSRVIARLRQRVQSVTGEIDLTSQLA
ncbi:MAG: RNA polymerase sigma factor [Verrucomicrobiota bacterium]